MNDTSEPQEPETLDEAHPTTGHPEPESVKEPESVTLGGGWCSPSEIIYDAFPEVTARRGGISFTKRKLSKREWKERAKRAERLVEQERSRLVTVERRTAAQLNEAQTALVEVMSLDEQRRQVLLRIKRTLDHQTIGTTYSYKISEIRRIFATEPITTSYFGRTKPGEGRPTAEQAGMHSPVKITVTKVDTTREHSETSQSTATVEVERDGRAFQYTAPINVGVTHYLLGEGA